MNQMKYIVFDTGAIIIFSESLSHEQVATALGLKENVQSAGQVSMMVEQGEVNAYGRSFTLGAKSDPNDSKRIYNQISFNA